jgi:membrane-bound lytic murein transglycosylase MltF
MNLTTHQQLVKDKIEQVAKVLGVNPTWAVSIAMTESSLGMAQESPTGCRGVFQMSSIAMKDLLQEMEKVDDELIDIACGISFLHLLIKRHKTIEEATAHFCDPNDRDFYIDRVKVYMKVFGEGV